MHPFCRVELARFISLSLTACARAPPESRPSAAELAQIASVDGLRFAAFVLGSKHAPLHAEFVGALRAAHAAHTAADADGAARWATAMGTQPVSDAPGL
jgi:hypothetical protein